MSATDELSPYLESETKAGSSALARQIEQGAPADLFISADSDWMNYLAGKTLIKPAPSA